MRAFLCIAVLAVVALGCGGSDDEDVSEASQAAAKGGNGNNHPTENPTFEPAPGAYTSPQAVTLSCTTPRAIIYYTTDGTEPRRSSTVYSGPISVSATTTINAIADAPRYSPSGTAIGTYTIEGASCVWDGFPGCYVGDACYPGYENARCGQHGGACLACPAECYCYGLCWYKDTGQLCPAPYATE